MDGMDLWKRVCATVTPLGKGGSRSRIRYVPSEKTPILDLHNHTVQQGYEAFLRAYEDWGDQWFIVVTGKGQMLQEFPAWADLAGATYRMSSSGGGFHVRKPKRQRNQ